MKTHKDYKLELLEYKSGGTYLYKFSEQGANLEEILKEALINKISNFIIINDRQDFDNNKTHVSIKIDDKQSKKSKTYTISGRKGISFYEGFGLGDFTTTSNKALLNKAPVFFRRLQLAVFM